MLPEQAAAMSALNAARYSVFFLLTLSDGAIVRAWLGVGDYDVPPHDLDPSGGTHLGIGLVGDVPALRQLIGGVAERVDFSLDGVNAEVMRLADRDAPLAKHARVNVGIVFFDEHWQEVAPIAWLWEGTADVPTISRPVGDSPVRSVSLSVGSAFTDRTRVSYGFYTPEDQKRRSPTDTFCDRVPSYGIDSSIVWPAAK